ncbi:BTB/POZ domain-containing protein [Ditylenchus destructor]|nr:BTB/POZ domain-containing protein [Ditylenchus destructor]
MDDDTSYVIVGEDQISSHDLDFRSRNSPEGVSMSPRTRRSQSCEKCLADMETNFIAEISRSQLSSCSRIRKKGRRLDFNKHWAKDVTFLVQSVPIFGDRNYLAEISPVFDRMFNGKFAEANQQEIELGDIKPDTFNDFLMAIWRKPVLPNSSNVFELLELADRFDVASLRENCERHLKISSEMKPVDKLILSQNYHLKNLQDFLVNQITAEVWLQWQKSENWQEKIGALNVITVSKITTNLALKLDILQKETERRNTRSGSWSIGANLVYCTK